MDNRRTSLIKKILAKGTMLTPFEAIHLKYLNRQGLLGKLVNIEKENNPYIATRDTTGIISPYSIDYIVRQTAKNDPDTYSSYNFAYENLIHQDSLIGKDGYKGLALLTQLTLMRHEHFVRLLLDKGFQQKEQELFRDFQDIEKQPIMRFSTYSLIHQEKVPFSQILSSFTETFKYFIKSTDNILTLNYYLNKLVKPEDLSCLDFLKMWLNNGDNNSKKEEHLRPFFNAAHLCFTEENVDYILKENHQVYVDSFFREIDNVSPGFKEVSLRYVKDLILNLIKYNNSLDEKNNN